MATTCMPLGVTAVMLPELSFPEQIEVCAKNGVTHYSWRPRIIPEEQRIRSYSPWGRHAFDLTPKRLVADGVQLRKQLEDAGLVSFGTLPAAALTSSDDELKEHLEGAALVGAGRIRVSPYAYGTGPFDYSELLNRTTDRYRQVVELARPFKQKLVIETHNRSLATSPALALNICQSFDPSELGVIFDINNFMIEGGLCPNLAVAVMGAYIDHCHIGSARRIDGQRDDQGFRTTSIEMCALTEGDMHIPTWIAALAEAAHRVPLIIENFADDGPSSDRLAESAKQLRSVFQGLP